MKAHIGVDVDSGLVRSLVGTPANTLDASQAHALLHSHEQAAFGDARYMGVDKLRLSPCITGEKGSHKTGNNQNASPTSAMNTPLNTSP